jgi:hypothetical protein
MPRSTRFCLVFAVLIASSASPASGSEPRDRFGSHHHLSLLGGYGRHLGRVPDYTVTIPEATVTPADLQDAVDAGARYRISLRPGFDLALEGHRVQATGTTRIHDLLSGTRTSSRRRVRTDWWGVGVRRTFDGSGFRPFLQGGVIHARESRRFGDHPWESQGSDLGVAFSAGGELALGASLSLPIEVGWVHVVPFDELSTLGLRSGLTWHPGR